MDLKMLNLSRIFLYKIGFVILGWLNFGTSYSQTHQQSTETYPGVSSSGDLMIYIAAVVIVAALLGLTWFFTIGGPGKQNRTYGSQIIRMLLCSSISLIILISSMSIVTLINIYSLGTEIEELAEIHVPMTEKLTIVLKNQFEQSIALERYMRIQNDSSKEKFNLLANKADQAIIEAQEIVSRGTQLLTGKRGLLELKDRLDEIKSKHLEFNAHGQSLFALYEQGGSVEEIEQLQVKSGKEEELLNQNIGNFLLKIEKEMVEVSKKAEYHEKSIMKSISVISFFAILLGLLFLLFSWKKISSFLSSIINQLSSVSDNISAASSQAMQGSQNLSEASNETAASLQETASSITEISSMVQKNTDNSKEASSLAIASRNSAESGEKEIKQLISSIHDISESAKKIEEITQVIDDIAFQTNLLALNAAVEAARAGDEGKGFAVVAEAVRNLAQRSADSAKEIASLIKENVREAENGVRVADSSGKVLNEIVTSAKKVADLITEVSAASDEQSEGIQQISTAINQVQTATQQNASTSEEFAAASQELSAQADQLFKLVSVIYTVEDNSQIDTFKGPSSISSYKSKQGSANGQNSGSFSKGNHPNKIIPLDDEDQNDDRDLRDVSGF